MTLPIKYTKAYLWALILWLPLAASAQYYTGQYNNLEYYLKAGLANSPLLKEYNNQVLANKIDSDVLKAGYRPQANLISNNAIAPVINGFGYDGAITNSGNYSTQLFVNKTFVGRRNLNTQFRSISLQTDSTIITAQISGQDLKRTITAQYITAYGEQQQLLQNEKINTLLQNEDIVLKKLTQNNIYRQTDYLTFLVTLKQQELQLRQLRIQYETDFANLNYLCGLFDTSAAATTLADPMLVLKPIPDPAVSVYFKKYFIDSLRLQNDISLINLTYRPRLSVFGDAGYLSSTHFYTDYHNAGASAGFSLSIPIFDGHKRQLNISRVKLLENTRANYSSFFALQYRQQIAQYMQQLNATRSLVADIQEQVDYTEGLINVNGKLLQTGDVKIADFVIAINNYLTAQYLITQNKISLFQIINQLNYYSR